ncbi:hypothetical protein MMAD_48120 [Mycolicibacterium madagascariense]|uniref:O-antigen polymerase n=1 Tax=Mycolicibacterium madagascariense TaxID=212765 RepID=A0A7I7XMR5_9MYCO|nr:hypothetical protein [Mycolicibacterium madagascariense]MCV7014258.1 hypothetical protein [Mycolicibacterium madagascariense]BBZ30517.1 hypothetical protein MMAD_48120 [Mycolicibacterium madagascariense]
MTTRFLDAPVGARPSEGYAPPGEAGSRVLAVTAFLLIGFRQTDLLPLVPLGLSPARFLLFAGAGLWVLTRLTGQRSPYRLAILGPVLTIYALSVMVAYGAQMTRPTPAPNIDPIFVVQLLLVLVVLFVFTVIHSAAGLLRVIKGLVAGACLSATLALLAIVTGSATGPVLRIPGTVDGAGIPFTVDDVFRGGMIRAQGSASHPLELACVLIVIFPLALAMTLSLRAQGKRWWPWAVASAVIVAGSAATLSRSGTVGLVVSMAVMACYWPIRRTVTIFASCAAVIGAALLLQVPFVTKYATIFSADSSVAQRAAVTSALPFDITPFGMYARATGASSSGAGVPTLDDQYLKALSETGVFGFLAYVLLIGTTVVLAFRAFRNARAGRCDRQRAQLFIGIAASISAYAVVSLFLDMAGFLQIWTLMWVLISLTAVAYRLSRTPGRDT